jgi:hypothetical protein
MRTDKKEKRKSPLMLVVNTNGEEILAYNAILNMSGNGIVAD